MAQLVGQPCSVCQKQIGWKGDSHFCRLCKSPVHNACAAGAATRTAPHKCPQCGAEVRPLADPGVNAYWLRRRQDRPGEKWVLEWSDAGFTLRKPDGQMAVQADLVSAHRAIDFHRLYTDGAISISTPRGQLVFERSARATKALREFVATGLRSDVDYQKQLLRRASCAVLGGLVLSVACGCLFGLYCWFASWAPDPPPGHWIEHFGGLIHGLLCALLAGIVCGG